MTDVTHQTPESQSADQSNDPAVGNSVSVSAPPLSTTPNLPMHAEPILGFIAPESGIGKELGKIGHEFVGYRNKMIHALPSVVVNHSSNVIGVTQLFGEVMMFKSGGTQLYGARVAGTNKPDYWGGKFQDMLTVKRPGLAKYLKWANPVIEPAYNVIKNATDTSGFEMPKVEWTPKGVLKAADNARRNIFDLEYATKNDLRASLEHLSKKDRLVYPKGKLVNRWQTRSTLMGITGMTIATFLPDDKDKPEEVQKLSEMAAKHPLQYAGHRLLTAINPLEWWDNKRAFVGLTMVLAGSFSCLTGFRNMSRERVGVQYFDKYVRNQPHSINGAITAVAGSQLLLGVDAEQGWARFGSTLWARMIFLPKSIGNRYKSNDPHANYYTSGQAAFQSANAIAFFTGGAEKKPDGTVIDQKAIREEAKKKAKEEKAKMKAEKTTTAGHNDLADASLVSPSLEAAPAVQVVAKPNSVIAANEAVHEAPEKSTAIAAA